MAASITFIVWFTQCMKDVPGSSGGDKGNSTFEGHIVLDCTEQTMLRVCVRKQSVILNFSHTGSMNTPKSRPTSSIGTIGSRAEDRALGRSPKSQMAILSEECIVQINSIVRSNVGRYHPHRARPAKKAKFPTIHRIRPPPAPGQSGEKNNGLAGNRTPDHSQDRFQSTNVLARC